MFQYYFKLLSCEFSREGGRNNRITDENWLDTTVINQLEWITKSWEFNSYSLKIVFSNCFFCNMCQDKYLHRWAFNVYWLMSLQLFTFKPYGLFLAAWENDGTNLTAKHQKTVDSSIYYQCENCHFHWINNIILLQKRFNLCLTSRSSKSFQADTALAALKTARNQKTQFRLITL